jgi:hypothetical protein
VGGDKGRKNKIGRKNEKESKSNQDLVHRQKKSFFLHEEQMRKTHWAPLSSKEFFNLLKPVILVHPSLIEQKLRSHDGNHLCKVTARIWNSWQKVQDWEKNCSSLWAGCSASCLLPHLLGRQRSGGLRFEVWAKVSKTPSQPISWVCWYKPLNPATHEAKIRSWSRPDWVKYKALLKK